VTPQSPEQPRDGYTAVLSRSLTQRILFGGVPREFAIVLWTLVAAFSLPLSQWLYAIPIGLAVHALAYQLCRRDPYFFELIVRHLRLPRYFGT